MNRRKKQIYGAILILGGLALVADRVTLQATEPTSAYAEGDATTSGLGLESPAGAVVSVAVTPFPSDLPPVSSEHALRDVFSTTDTIRAEMQQTASDDAGGPGRRAVRERSASESLEQDRSLTAVMLGERSSFAIVDDQWLRVGDRIGECELTAMTGTTATFHCADGDVTLSVKSAETGGSGGN